MSKRTDEADKIIAVATRYFHAMIDQDGPELRQVFHPRAMIVGNFGASLEYATLEEFIASTGDARTGAGPFDFRLEGLDMVGDTAIVRLGNYSYGNWFTDHLSMVRIDGEWRIVCKIYFAHPPA